MRLVLVALIAACVLTAAPAAADEPTCADAICAIPGPPSGPQVPAPSPVADGPPRQPVHGMSHPTSPGPGHDVRPCVSTREFRGAEYGTTKRDLEERWEVVGLGRLRDVVVVGLAWVYPRCGRPERAAFFAVTYRQGRVDGKVSVSN